MIRLARAEDIDGILKVKDEAVVGLKADGVNQWQDGYPNAQMFLDDIKNKTLFVNDDGMVRAMCNLSFAIDPSYEQIYDGAWLTNSTKYLVIHRIAVNKASVGKGIGTELFRFAFDYGSMNNARSIKIDTHKDNFRMRSILCKLGYEECGKIYLVNYHNTDNMRIAYELLITN